MKSRKTLEKLASALGSFDLSASGEALSELGTIGTSAEVAADLAKVRELVDGYEYDEAAAIVSGLLQHLEMSK